ncbi:MAG: CoA transferase [Nocardioidaceae bacterium]
MTDTESQPTESGPLSGVLVLDLSRALAGPQAAMMLGDLGARVIKLESPEGDESRLWGPPFAGGESTYFLSCNRNKESVVVDLTQEGDQELLRRLVAKADVLVENFRPGVLARLGFGEQQLHELNPRLVIGSVTGFGHDGPEASRPGYDQVAQGEGGLMSITGTAGPTRVGVPIADLLAGMNIAYGLVAALFERAHTGRGRVVRTSLLASMVGIHGFQGTRWTVAGEHPGLVGNHHPNLLPYGLFDTATGPLTIACGTERQWVQVSRLLDLPDDPRFADNETRVRNRGHVLDAIQQRLSTESAEHWLALLEQAGVPSGLVRSIPEVYAWEQTRSQGLLVDVEHPTAGTLTLPGPVLRLDDQAYAGGRRTHLAPPTLGQHTDAVRAEVGLTDR